MVGGCGFIGSHLVELLARDPEQRITVVDDLSSAPLPPERLLAELGNPPNVDLVEAEAAAYARNGSRERFDQVFQLASPVGPAGVLEHAGSIAWRVIDVAAVYGELCHSSGARLVFVSSSEVYDGGQDGLCSEQMPRVVGPEPSARREYAAAKIAAEVLLGNLAKTRGLDVVLVRPFNVAGPRQSARGGFVLPRFVSQALAGEPLTVFGDGRQTRAFTHVAEIASGILAAARHAESGEVFNLGNGDNCISILELAEAVKSYTRSSSPVTFVDPREIYGDLYEDANDKLPDDALARRRLGWSPHIDCRAIVAETADYFRSLTPDLRRHLGA